MLQKCNKMLQKKGIKKRSDAYACMRKFINIYIYVTIVTLLEICLIRIFTMKAIVTILTLLQIVTHFYGNNCNMSEKVHSKIPLTIVTNVGTSQL